MKRFIRQNKQIAGVCGGIGKYFNIDETLVRIGFVLGLCIPGIPAGLIYLVIWACAPEIEDIDNNIVDTE